jgi:hypothetical protein
MERSKMTIENVRLNVSRKSRNRPGIGKTITNRIDITLTAIKALPPYPCMSFAGPCMSFAG